MIKMGVGPDVAQQRESRIVHAAWRFSSGGPHRRKELGKGQLSWENALGLAKDTTDWTTFACEAS